MLAACLTRKLLLSCSLLLVSVPSPAQDTSGETPAQADFRRGVELFQQGDLKAARQRLEAARAAGLDSMTLHYNLGVVYYRLGQLDAAEESFARLLSSPHETLARYNLGLIALARNDEPVARDYFLSVIESDGPDKLQDLARARLADMGRQVAVSDRRPRRLYLAASGGYDSNIAGLPETATTREGGLFLDAVVAGSARLHGDRSSGWDLEGAFFGRDYPDDDDYNTKFLQGKLAWSEQDAGLSRQLGAVLSQSWFGPDAFETRYGVEGLMAWTRCPVALPIDDCDVSLAAARVDGGSSFEAYDGQWYRLRARAGRWLGAWNLEGKYLWELNDRSDLTSGSQFVSVSPQHHAVEGVARYSVWGDLVLGAMGGFRYSRYQDPHRLLEGDMVVVERRTDRRWETGTFAEYGLSRRWLLRGEWLFRDNSSEIDSYSYQRHTFMVTLEGVL
ncbi:tetratricopeptide repeat protein [Marinobacter pelagius]|uniref:Tetratricopeptide repeat protein n=1 Tax=Marinobacter pelagius TaxID=379482 RepID=A0A366GKG9_9GAMM|nr:tetratricopeptide repeat protein [Marinobacter pelagius]RBP26432.1 tetratricopeptide repeat protein [Marinobacter pelagius]